MQATYFYSDRCDSCNEIKKTFRSSLRNDVDEIIRVEELYEHGKIPKFLRGVPTIAIDKKATNQLFIIEGEAVFKWLNDKWTENMEGGKGNTGSENKEEPLDHSSQDRMYGEMTRMPRTGGNNKQGNVTKGEPVSNFGGSPEPGANPDVSARKDGDNRKISKTLEPASFSRGRASGIDGRGDRFQVIHDPDVERETYGEGRRSLTANGGDKGSKKKGDEINNRLKEFEDARNADTPRPKAPLG